jgi:hypothetical protein
MQDQILEKFGDFGAESSRRDRFHEHYSVHWCINMFFDASITEIILEYGEDLVVNRNGNYELHQVKTKQESVQEEWNVTNILPIIGKTFAMVPYFGNVTKCCFVSNEKAKGTLYKLKSVINQPDADWSLEEKSVFEDFCTNHNKRILKEMQKVDKENTETVTDVQDRLLTLRIDTDFHHMEYIQDTNIRRLRQAIENSYAGTGIVFTDEDIAEIYEALIGVVGKAVIGKTRIEKSINREDILNCINVPINRRTLYRFPTEEEVLQAPGRTRLEKKLMLGGFTPVYIEEAREVMVEVMNQEKKWGFGKAEELLQDICFRMKYLCSDAYDIVCTANPRDEKVGRKILDRLKLELPNLIEYYGNLGFVEEIFLVGIAWQLTAECKAYWSQHKPL